MMDDFDDAFQIKSGHLFNCSASRIWPVVAFIPEGLFLGMGRRNVENGKTQERRREGTGRKKGRQREEQMSGEKIRRRTQVNRRGELSKAYRCEERRK